VIPFNFLHLKQQLGILIEGNANSTLAYIGEKINDAYVDLCNMFRLDACRRSVYLQLTAPYVTGTVSVNAGAVAVVGVATAFTANMVGQSMLLNGQVYEIAAVTDGTNLTLARPYEGSAALAAVATAIYYDAYDLPWGCDYPRIITARNPYNNQDLKIITKEKFDKYFPNPTNVGVPVFLCPAGYKEDRYPAAEGGTFVAAATTSTTALVMPAGGDAVDDYYNDWMLINTTRNLVARVTDYVASTKTLTVSPPVTAQVATDVVYLKKRLAVVGIYPMPSSAQAVQLSYFVEPDRMVNDYDVPWAIPDRYHRAIYLRAASHGMLIRDDVRKKEVDRDYNLILTEMSGEYNVLEGETFDKQGVDESKRVGEDNFYSTYNFPLGV